MVPARILDTAAKCVVATATIFVAPMMTSPTSPAHWPEMALDAAHICAVAMATAFTRAINSVYHGLVSREHNG